VAIRLTWHNLQKSILLVYYPDGWTWEDFDAAFDAGKALLETVTHGVYVIHYSESGFQRLPRGSALPHLKRSSDSRPKNLLKSFVVAPYPATYNFLSMLFPILPANKEHIPNVVVNSIEEALAHIEETSAG
jgi:hypothetical protein